MKLLLYRSVKIALGVIGAIFLAEGIGLMYSTTAGVIAMLSILDTRKQTLYVGFKRIWTSLMAILIVTILFALLGHNLLVFGLFLLLYVPLMTWLKASEALTVNTVLVTHIYTLQSLGVGILMNEMALTIIGVLVAWVLNLHMPNLENEIRMLQMEVEDRIKGVLEQIEAKLMGQDKSASTDRLDDLKIQLDEGTKKAYIYHNNYILKDHRYFIKYFQMRKEQYRVLKHMNQLFHESFITVKEALPIGAFTHRLVIELNECNDGEDLLRALKDLKNHYKASDLPVTREEFEHRAVLFQYLNDLEHFIEIKSRFMVDYGAIVYCHHENSIIKERK
ncbi:conserved membrane protein of unknown function [Petrocella atlantisensis]|uniref:Putative aromatic acid exporter C-terminal domain-containing protein n=1 Tax=Petrocella atlantisensis TaxID=2173034 RepID=A0A3P7PDN0_9FIRM|nr:aromatic acid exporter family protein [Petrocella atlantisensis]VDN48173.1 conserved membrane protein of unknown function [Petrocella atlantisensis]